ncbi:somatomedin-B and thrombospondin type-1 domain-containing protein [Vespula squamosa]|uniref:Somatomedin-B and thrombospondin type-1 domain-containing protein n=1 Tax=Vespula squamosa TaxID=30214 RepID=A0ABD2C1D5_VESSQ
MLFLIESFLPFSQRCVAFTIVRASRACKRISSFLAEGTRICVERHEDDEEDEDEDEEGKGGGGDGGGGAGGGGGRRDGRRGNLLVGIGRWKLSTSVDGGSAARTAMNSSCHGKWIGDSRLLIDCDDPSCGETTTTRLRVSRRLRRSLETRDDLNEDYDDMEDDFRRTKPVGERFRRWRRSRRRKRSRRRRNDVFVKS